MRKALIFCLLTLFLCGCDSGHKSVTPVMESVAFTACGCYGETEVTCRAVFDTDGDTLTVIEPKSLAGLCYRRSGNTVTADYAQLSVERPSCTDSFSDFLFAVFDSAETALCTREGKNYALEKTVGNETVKLLFSPQGYPLSIQNRAGKTVFTFFDVRVLTKD